MTATTKTAERLKDEHAARLFFNAVLREVESARKKFPTPNHLTLALVEECGEVVKAICDARISGWQTRENHRAVYKEIVQTAAMCVRLAVEGDATQHLVW